MLETSRGLSTKALALNPLNPDSHKWYAIASGSLAKFQSLKDKIAYGQTVPLKAHIDNHLFDSILFYFTFRGGCLTFPLPALSPLPLPLSLSLSLSLSLLPLSV